MLLNCFESLLRSIFTLKRKRDNERGSGDSNIVHSTSYYLDGDYLVSTIRSSGQVNEDGARSEAWFRQVKSDRPCESAIFSMELAIDFWRS